MPSFARESVAGRLFTAPLAMSDAPLAAALPASFPPSTRPPPPPTDPEPFAALDTLPAAVAAGDAGLFVAVEAVDLCAAAAGGDLGGVAEGGAAETQEGEEGEEGDCIPLREALVVGGDGVVRVLEAAAETRLRREDAAGLDADGAPTRLEVPGVGRVAVVCGLEGFGAEEEGVGVEVAADVGERKAAAAASSFSRRILYENGIAPPPSFRHVGPRSLAP